ncbi:unnamed protein product (macronuclear) [Paramecium tetraurelia]|uniref:Transmembrane protein n=1 Tax=Paramecium tetraurelia TaxID=5888 RepID=A0EC96_PARTE|nr:uncharacterized protein GSPATT00025650001 [Paramecium tetraurelia]CAK92913.1 unnamed protein product [Paramecium tetraurelia]|eukprot:XP_001460310.1 hypothetical protein (macronuclear) [Paramecium tetraurelia strain d4-2]
MLPILILTFITLARQETTKLNFSQFDEPLKIKQIYYLTRFIDLEKSLNLTTQQTQENANFALELWINTENVLNQTTNKTSNHSILNIIDNKQFQSIIPQDQEGLQATEQYIEQWQNQTDDDKSIILQIVIQNINEMIQSEDPENYNQTILIEQISNQTNILDENKKNINTTTYISPLTWQHANVSQEEMAIAYFFYDTKIKNLTVQEEFNNLTTQDAAALISAFEKFFVNTSKNQNTTSNTNTSTNISSKGEKPIEKEDELPFPQSNNDSEDPIYMYLVFALMFFMLIAILFLLRRYLIQQKLITFQMNEESNVQGFQA